MKMIACGRGIEQILRSERNNNDEESVDQQTDQFHTIPFVTRRRTSKSRMRTLRDPKIKHIACGRSFVVVVTESDDIYTMGSNQYGQLGMGEKPQLKQEENDSDSVTTSPNGDVFDRFVHMDYLHVEVKLLACGANHTILVTQDNEMYSCGGNMFGECGLGHSHDAHEFQKVELDSGIDNEKSEFIIEQVSCGSEHSFIRTRNHELWSCGQNYAGQLGLGTMNNESRFQKVSLELQENESDAVSRNNRDVIELKQVSCGDNHTVLLTMNNEIWTCGSNIHGALGTESHSEMRKVSDIVAKFMKLNVHSMIGRPIESIYCGETHTVLLTKDGMLYTCGSSQKGSLGLDDVNFTQEFTRVPIKPLEGATLPANSCPIDSTTILFKNRDYIMTCGNNRQENLGLGRSVSHSGRLRKLILDIESNMLVQQIALGSSMTFIAIGPKTVNSGIATQMAQTQPLEAVTPSAIEKLQQEVERKNQEIEMLQKQISSTSETQESDFTTVLGPWLIDGSDIVFERQISSDTSLGTWSSSPVLMKSVPKNTLTSIELSRLTELATIRHPNCQQYLGFNLTESGDLRIIYEYSESNLHDLLRASQVRLSVVEKVKLALEVAKGLSFLHKRQPQLAHGNLTSHSVFLNSNGSMVKIGDYRLVIDQNATVDPISNDAYQFGMILHELWFWGLVEESEADLSIRHSLQGPMITLLHSCTAEDPSCRLPISIIADQLQRVIKNMNL